MTSLPPSYGPVSTLVDRGEREAMLATLPLDRIPEGGELLLVVRSGSKSYGTDHAGSDDDLRGIYMAPVEDLLSVQPPADAITPPQDARGRIIGDDDYQLFELQKYMQAAGWKRNPSMLEMLWAPVLYVSERGALLRANRERFLCQRLFNTYYQYSLSQLMRSVDVKRPPTDKQRVKQRIHAQRVVEQVAHILTYGDLRLSVGDPVEMRRIAEGSYEEVRERVDELVMRATIARFGSELPLEPRIQELAQLNMLIRGVSVA